MRSFVLTFLGLFCMQTAGFSQYQKPVEKGVIKTPTVQCDICKEKVEFFIGHEYGVSAVKVDIKKKTTTVTWLTDRTNLENIKVSIANLGYDADDIEAEETTFNRLPKPCRMHKQIIKPPVPVKEKRP